MAMTVPTPADVELGKKVVESYAAGFKDGLEAAAKVAETFSIEFIFKDGRRTYSMSNAIALEIRALSPPPSATVDGKTNALPRPGE